MSFSALSAQSTALASIGGCNLAAFFSSASMSSPQAGALLLSVVAGVLLCISGPSELPEVAIGVLGACIYLMYQTRSLTPKKAKKMKVADANAPTLTGSTRHSGESERRRSAPKPRATHEPRQEYRQESIVPVQSVVFQSVGWEAEVPELLHQICPNEESDLMVQQLVRAVQRALQPLIPEAEVVGCASGNIKGKRAFGVAIPEVDIVMTVSPGVLIDRLKSRLPNGAYLAKLDAKKLQKAAIRACADQLVSVGGFKFRRSAFKGEEPKFTLLAPAALAAGDCTTAIDFSVNAATPLQATALFREVSKHDPRASDVILLMRRWARDRGIAHAARGHLSPYGWTLLATYFLQTSAVEGGSGMLPAVPSVSSKSPAPGSGAIVSPKLSSAELFKRCLLFYSKFNWRKEGVSVRLGRRTPPGLALPLNVTLSWDGKSTHVAPSIEDPFDESRNIAASMTAEGVVRLGEELSRASRLISDDASLSQLLELWAPEEGNPAVDAAEARPR